MKTPHFSAKLDGLPATLDLLAGYEPRLLASALSRSAARHALAIGSGGSAVAAEFLSRCRDTLGLGATSVQTPMQAVMELHDLDDSEVWLFSAGGENADIVAAARAVLDRHCARLHILTRNPTGAAAGIVESRGGTVHVVPVADEKDGYLATHSLLAFTGALLIASDLASREPRGSAVLLDTLVSHLMIKRDPQTRALLLDKLSALRRQDTIIIAADPLLRPLAVLIDTSLWEASLCPVQTTDFRNLAHGRHAWLHHRAGETCVIALAGSESGVVWDAIDGAIPADIHRHTMRYGGCGRLENVLALLDGLGLIEAIGETFGIDPGKPGIGEFGRTVYDDRSLAVIADQLSSTVRHKRSAIARADASTAAVQNLAPMASGRLAALALVDIGGIVFDYDGTIVTTEGRFDPPSVAITTELLRLHGSGVRIGIATGRGGSAGKDLRDALPEDVLRTVVIGYYNGGHVRTADIDIANDRPASDPSIVGVAEWLRNRPDLFIDPKFDAREVQITVAMACLRHPYRFALDLMDCPFIVSGGARVLGSGHSYDIVPAGSSKLVVVDRLRAAARHGEEILCFGDSGSGTGNDNALLSHPFGISVGEVCGAVDGCWSLFGSRPSGPDALLRVLQALVPTASGHIRLDVESLGLDTRHGMST